MKIIVISSSVFPVPLRNYGGLEEIAYQCAKGLAERGHQVGLVAPDGSSCPGVQVIHCGPPGTFDERKAYGGNNKPGEYAGYWQHLPNADCLIDHSWMKFSMTLKEEGVFKGPILGVMHAPVASMYKTLPKVDKPCFVCISEDQKNSFEGLFNKSARTCYNGVDLAYYQSLNIPRSDRFLFLARFSTIKGPLLCIEACLKAGVGLDLVGDISITGEPEYFAQCKAKADGKQIRIIGSATRGECVWWYSQAKALLHGNLLFREPYGLAPVEAMAAGCPVIGFDNGACRETVLTGNPDTDAGYLAKDVADFEAKVKEAATTDIAEKWRKNCRAQAEKQSINRMISRYEELCLEAVTKGGW